MGIYLDDTTSEVEVNYNLLENVTYGIFLQPLNGHQSHGNVVAWNYFPQVEHPFQNTWLTTAADSAAWNELLNKNTLSPINAGSPKILRDRPDDIAKNAGPRVPSSWSDGDSPPSATRIVSSGSTASNSSAARSESAAAAAAVVGLFRVGLDSIFYSSGAAVCSYSSFDHFKVATGLSSALNLPELSVLPANLIQEGVCGMPAGLFIVGEGIYYSNGIGHCAYRSWSDFVSLTGRTSTEGIPILYARPTTQRLLGTCGQ